MEAEHKPKPFVVGEGKSKSNGGLSGILETHAAFFPVTAHVRDYQYVSHDTDELIEQAKSRLMWGASLTQTPYVSAFGEPLRLFDEGVEKAAAKERAKNKNWPEHLLKSTYEQLYEKELLKIKLRTRQSNAGVPRVPASATVSRRVKMKNRTRNERIIDLQTALKKGAT